MRRRARPSCSGPRHSAVSAWTTSCSPSTTPGRTSGGATACWPRWRWLSSPPRWRAAPRQRPASRGGRAGASRRPMQVVTNGVDVERVERVGEELPPSVERSRPHGRLRRPDDPHQGPGHAAHSVRLGVAHPRPAGRRRRRVRCVRARAASPTVSGWSTELGSRACCSATTCTGCSAAPAASPPHAARGCRCPCWRRSRPAARRAPRTSTHREVAAATAAAASYPSVTRVRSPTPSPSPGPALRTARGAGAVSQEGSHGRVQRPLDDRRLRADLRRAAPR